jgi:hypothetical protein
LLLLVHGVHLLRVLPSGKPASVQDTFHPPRRKRPCGARFLSTIGSAFSQICSQTGTCPSSEAANQKIVQQVTAAVSSSPSTS